MEPRICKLLSISPRTAEVWLKHNIAAIGQKLRNPIKTNAVASVWTTMRQYHRGKVLRDSTRRQGNVCRNREPVARRVRIRLHLSEIAFMQAGISCAEQCCAMGYAIDNVVAQ